MTEPVARTPVRRTVRLAVALVVGQALLCAVIGWVTFGASHAQHPVVAIPTDEPLAAKPLVPRPVVAPPPRSSVSPSKKAKVAPSASRSTRESPPPSLAAPPSPPPSSGPKTNSGPVKPESKPVPPGPALPTPKSGGEAQSPVKLLDVCDPVDAKGLTAEGVSVHCVKGDDGTLHWQIN